MQNDRKEFVLVSRNDGIVYAADEGGQCDPFMGGEAGLAAKGAFFTVRNAVACGQHWTDYMTFKYSEKHGGFLFQKRISEFWEFNPSPEPGADALVLSRRVVKTTDARKQISLSDYRPDPQ